MQASPLLAFFCLFPASCNTLRANQALSFPAKAQLNLCPHVAGAEHNGKQLGKAYASLAWQRQSRHAPCCLPEALGALPRPSLHTAAQGRAESKLLGARLLNSNLLDKLPHCVRPHSSHDLLCVFEPGWEEPSHDLSSPGTLHPSWRHWPRSAKEDVAPQKNSMQVLHRSSGDILASQFPTPSPC